MDYGCKDLETAEIVISCRLKPGCHKPPMPAMSSPPLSGILLQYMKPCAGIRHVDSMPSNLT